MTSAYKNFKIVDIMAIAKAAGDCIMLHRGKVEAKNKSDGSPVTIADKEASEIIIKGLEHITPDIPVVSEEASNEDNLKAIKNPVRWVTDPLDGTKTFLSGHAGFGVHIALIEDGVPVKGVVYFPAEGENGQFYFTGDNGNAYKQEGFDGVPEKISVTKSYKGRNLRVAVHYKDDKRPVDISGQFYDAVFGVGGGRICVVAEGKADIAWMMRESSKWAYSHWDVAAAHAVLKAAGGDLIDAKTGKPVTYSNENFGVPGALAGHRKILKYLLKDGWSG